MRSLSSFLSVVFCLAASLSLHSPLFAQKSVAELLSSIVPPNEPIEYNDGARQVAVQDQYLFITNIWAGLQVVNIADPENPRQVSFFPSADEAFYTAIEGRYAYLANQASGIQVFDVSDLSQVREAGRIKTPGNTQWLVAEYPYLFVALGQEGFAIMDISDMDNAITIKLEIPGQWIQQIYKQGSLLYLAAKKGGLITYDVSDFENPRKLSQFRTGFNTMMVQVQDDVAYIADGPGGLLCMNISRPEFPLEMSRVGNQGFVSSLYKAGNYAYLANRDLGLQIVNVTDPAQPFVESVYATDDKAYGVFKKDIFVYLAANDATLVMRHNNAPILEPVGDRMLDENVAFTLQMRATEPDGDSLVYTAENLPEGALFNAGAGAVSWTPTYEQSGAYSDIIFSVTEQTRTGLQASDTVTFTVNHVNRLPDLPGLENHELDESDSLNFVLPEGSDPDVEDQERLAYRAENVPKGATFDPTNRAFSWTPTFEQSGVYIVDFLLDDGGGGIDREPVTLTINHVDRPPVIDPVDSVSIAENEPLTVELNGMEPDSEDQDKISFSIDNLPQGAVFDPGTRIMTWTPTFDQSGNYRPLTAIMTAGQFSDSSAFSIAVTHVNRPPVHDDVPAMSVNENEVLTFSVSGGDPDVEDEGLLIYSAEDLPPGAVFDAAQRTFTWTPDYDQSGEYPEVNFTVTDPSGLADGKSTTISVVHVNRAPQLGPVADQAADENTTLAIQLVGSDPDSEDQGKLRYSAVGLPEGASIDPTTGSFSWAPTYDQSGDYPLTFVVSDGAYSDSAAVQIQIHHVNRPPVLDPLSDMGSDENTPVSIVLNGSDPDREDEGLLAYSTGELPEGATFDADSRTFSWLPTYEQSGTYPLDFTVADPAGLSASRNMVLTVTHVNRPPMLEPIADLEAQEDSPLAFQASGRDDDREDTGKLVYSVSNLPAGASIDGASGAFSWTPGFDQAGEYTLNLVLTDGSGLSASEAVGIVVQNVNRPPAMEEIPLVNGSENAPLQFTVNCSDPDAEDAGKLVISLQPLPAGASLDNSSGLFTWTPGYDQAGEYAITASVTDSYGASVSTNLTITVAQVNREPILSEIRLTPLLENQSFTLALPVATDPDPEDAGKLTYTMSGLPNGASFDASSRTLSWQPGYEQAGDYPVTLSVSDGSATVTQTLHLHVDNANRPPRIAAAGSHSVREGATLELNLSAEDPDPEDASSLEIEARNLPSGATFDGGNFAWTPGADQQGTYSIEFVVRDAAGEIDKTTASIVVEDVPEPEPAPDPESGEE